MSEWKEIDTYDENLGTVLFGSWFEDTYQGYYGESRWHWIASGRRDAEGFFCDFDDEEFTSSHFHEVTHWMPLPGPPK